MTLDLASWNREALRRCCHRNSFSNSLLREVQSEFALMVARRGMPRFIQGLMVIQADTVTAAAHQQVHLVLVAQGGSRIQLDDQELEAAKPASKHPLTWQGKVTFHGLGGSMVQPTCDWGPQARRLAARCGLESWRPPQRRRIDCRPFNVFNG